MLGLDDELAGWIGLRRADASPCPCDAAIVAPRLAHRLQVRHAGAHCACAAPSRRSAPSAARASILRSSLCCSRSSCSSCSSRHASKRAEARIRARRVLAAIQPDRAARQIFQEAAVMADEHQRAALRGQIRLPAIRSRAGRDDWSARPAAVCSARAPARARARRGGFRRRTASPGSRRRSGRAAPADIAPDADHRPVRARRAHRRSVVAYCDRSGSCGR